MEGVSSEAASLAGHLRLDNLCWIYDNNHITIDGKTRLTYEDDVAARFMGYGWNVTRVGDANDLGLLDRAFEEFKREEDRPTLIIVDCHIGWGSPHKQDTPAAHGEPLGAEEVKRDQARLRLARGRPVPRPRRRPRALRRGRRQARRRGARRLDAPLRVAQSRVAGARRADRRDAAPRAPRGLGRRDPHLRRRRSEGDGDPQGLEQSRERDRRAPPLARRRLRRPHRLDLGPPHLRRRHRPRARLLRRPPDPLRHPRARVGGDLQRPLADQAAPALVDLPHLLRLRPPGDPPLGADGAAGRSTSSPTTRSASARTARPTSRSSRSPASARSPAST